MIRVPERRVDVLRAELTKIPAFLRRDLLTEWSYRLAFILDWSGLVVQALIFGAVQGIVDPNAIPTFDGRQASYLEFAAVGIALSSFMGIALARVFSVFRQEQVQGTLESLLLTPTAFTTMQLGSVAYDLIYVPIRTTIFFVFTTVVLGTSFRWSGLGPAILVLVAFIPFVWGIGILAAAWTITFKKGTGVVGIFITLLTITSGTYFPISVLPGWVRSVAKLSPLTITLDAARDALIGGVGWIDVMPAVAILVPCAALSLVAGIGAFRAALSRERHRGTLGLY